MDGFAAASNADSVPLSIPPSGDAGNSAACCAPIKDGMAVTSSSDNVPSKVPPSGDDVNSVTKLVPIMDEITVASNSDSVPVREPPSGVSGNSAALQPPSEIDILQLHLDTLTTNAAYHKLNHRTSPVWNFFCNEHIKGDAHVVVCCICRTKELSLAKIRHALASKKKDKGIMIYKHKNGTTAMKNHVLTMHAKLFEEFQKHKEANDKKPKKRKKPEMTNQQKITKKLAKKLRSEGGKKYLPNSKPQKQFDNNLRLMVMKGLQAPNMVCNNPYFRNLVLHLDPKVSFPSRHVLQDKIVPQLRSNVEKVVYNTLTRSGNVLRCAITFDLWMSRNAEDIFGVMMHFIDSEWSIKLFNIGLMKMEHTNGEALKTIFEGECEKYGILEKTIAFVSDEGKNLETCIKAFETSILCADISSRIVQGPFWGLCNAHMISKSIGWVFVKQDKDTPAVDSDLSLIDVQSAKKNCSQTQHIQRRVERAGNCGNRRRRTRDSPLPL